MLAWQEGKCIILLLLHLMTIVTCDVEIPQMLLYCLHANVGFLSSKMEMIVSTDIALKTQCNVFENYVGENEKIEVHIQDCVSISYIWISPV